MYKENKWVKAGVITIGSLALIYFLGQFANIFTGISRDLGILGCFVWKAVLSKKCTTIEK